MSRWVAAGVVAFGMAVFLVGQGQSEPPSNNLRDFMRVKLSDSQKVLGVAKSTGESALIG